jgi:hypothetical protein
MGSKGEIIGRAARQSRAGSTPLSRLMFWFILSSLGIILIHHDQQSHRREQGYECEHFVGAFLVLSPLFPKATAGFFLSILP